MKAGFSCHNVMSLPENCCSTLFTTGYKRLAEGGNKTFAFGFWAFGLLGFWLWLLDEGRLFDVGGFGRQKDY
jgi:hypothetical protein